jgi:hypothetical protein
LILIDELIESCLSRQRLLQPSSIRSVAFALLQLQATVTSKALKPVIKALGFKQNQHLIGQPLSNAAARLQFGEVH